MSTVLSAVEKKMNSSGPLFVVPCERALYYWIFWIHGASPCQGSCQRASAIFPLFAGAIPHTKGPCASRNPTIVGTNQEVVGPSQMFRAGASSTYGPSSGPSILRPSVTRGLTRVTRILA